MEERRTTAWVLGIIGLGVILFTAILPEIRARGTQTVSFKNCTISFKYEDPALDADIYRAAQNKLGFCLCNSYQQKRDTSIGNLIIQIYRQYGNHRCLPNNVDSIIKHKNDVLDTLIAVD